MLSGRNEHTKKILNTATKKMGAMPLIIQEYIDECAKQATSKVVMTNIVLRFLNYIDKKGYSMYNKRMWPKIDYNLIMEFFKEIRIKKKTEDGQIIFVKADTLINYQKAIDNFCNYMVRKKYMVENPCPSKEDVVKILPQVVTEEFKPVAMTIEEVKTVKQYIINKNRMPKRDLCIFMLGCRYGIRAEALSEIDIDDFTLEGENPTLVIIDKGGFQREVLLGLDDVRLIKECLEERGEVKGISALFVTQAFNGVVKRLSSQGIGGMIDRSTRCIDKHITPHKMRSTCITITYNDTNDIFAAAEQAGHRNVQNTRRYIDTSKTKKERARRMNELI